MTETLLKYPTTPLTRPAALLLALRTLHPDVDFPTLLTGWAHLLLLAPPEPLNFLPRSFTAKTGTMTNAVGVEELRRIDPPVDPAALKSELITLCAPLGLTDSLGHLLYITPLGVVFRESSEPDKPGLIPPTVGLLIQLYSTQPGDGGSYLWVPPETPAVAPPVAPPAEPLPKPRLGGPSRY